MSTLVTRPCGHGLLCGEGPHAQAVVRAGSWRAGRHCIAVEMRFRAVRVIGAACAAPTGGVTASREPA